MNQRKVFSGSIGLAYTEYSPAWDYESSLPDLVLFHGLFGMADNWHSIALGLLSFAQRVSMGLRILSVDLPGHGQSGSLDKLDYSSMAEVVVEFIQQNVSGKPVLLGHSMGGKVAIRAAQLLGENMAGLVVVDIAPKDYPDKHSDILQGLLALPIQSLTTRSACDSALEKSVSDPVTRGFLLKNLRKNSSGSFEWTLDLMGISRSYEAIRTWSGFHDTIPVPVLWVSGELSDYFQSGDRDLVRKIAPDSGFLSLSGAGHLVHIEKRDEFLAGVWDFFSALNLGDIL